MKENTIANMNRKPRRTFDRPLLRKATLGHRSRAISFAILSMSAVLVAPWGVRQASAQNGKIAATILDAKTGEPLLKATVKIIETRQGAYTKENGIGTIINIAPDENYTVVASYAGYLPDTLRHVKVSSDLTTHLKFKLGNKEKVITVIAEAPLVDKSKTDVGTKFDQSEFAAMPGRQRIDQIILLTPGVVPDNSNGGFSIHGSRGSSNSIRINGVENTDPLTGQAASLQQSISRLAISEIDVVTGSADASKGNFVGGEVNTQTRGGRDDLEFSAHYRTEIPGLFGYSAEGYQQMPAGDNLYEFSLGGPLITEDIKFFITGKLNSFAHYNVITDPVLQNYGLGVSDPLGDNLGEEQNTGRYRRSATGKLAFNALGFSVTANAELSSESDQNVLADPFGAGVLYENPYYYPGEQSVNNIYSLTARGEVGNGGILDMTASYTVIDRQYGKYDESQPVNLFNSPQFYATTDNYSVDASDGSVTPGSDKIIDIYSAVNRQIPDPADPTKSYTTASPTGINPFTGHIEGGEIIQSAANAYGLVGFFAVAGNPAGFLVQNTSEDQFSGQYSIQMGSHFLLAGVEGNLMTIAKNENDLPWDANPFKDSFLVHPYTAAAYIDDKMEFSDITFHPGLRFDMYQPNSFSINDLYNPIPNGVSATSIQTQLSPRLGITYAVTDQTTFNFGYNWYFKQPSLNDVLSNTAGGNLASLAAALVRGNQVIGDAGLAAERTKEVTVGFNTQLSDVFAFSVNGTYKDLRNQDGLELISSPLLPSGYTIYTDDEYGNYRGIEFIAQKRMSDNYSAKLQYTISSAQGTSSSATEAYSQLINQDPSGLQSSLPLTPFPFSYDKTNVADLAFNVNYGKNEGPTVFGAKIFEYFTLQTETEYYTGTPYTQVNLRGAQVGAINGEREPDYFETDATLTRTIPFEDIIGPSMKTVFLDLQLEVTNVFNRTTALEVYPVTGEGSNDGTNGLLNASVEYYNDPTNVHGGQYDALGNLFYDPRIDLNHDGRVSLAEQQVAYTTFRNENYARATSYQIPRRVYFNATIRF